MSPALALASFLQDVAESQPDSLWCVCWILQIFMVSFPKHQGLVPCGGWAWFCSQWSCPTPEVPSRHMWLETCRKLWDGQTKGNRFVLRDPPAPEASRCVPRRNPRGRGTSPGSYWCVNIPDKWPLAQAEDTAWELVSL